MSPNPPRLSLAVAVVDSQSAKRGRPPEPPAQAPLSVGATCVMLGQGENTRTSSRSTKKKGVGGRAGGRLARVSWARRHPTRPRACLLSVTQFGWSLRPGLPKRRPRGRLTRSQSRRHPRLARQRSPLRSTLRPLPWPSCACHPSLSARRQSCPWLGWPRRWALARERAPRPRRSAPGLGGNGGWEGGPARRAAPQAAAACRRLSPPPGDRGNGTAPSPLVHPARRAASLPRTHGAAHRRGWRWARHVRPPHGGGAAIRDAGMGGRALL